MKKFFKKGVFFGFFMLLIATIGVLMPTTPRASKSLLYAKIQKDSLLRHVHMPRIIFVGGSNLSFGLNSQLIKDSLSFFPINTAVHASIGLKYMLDNTIQYVRAGDIIVIAPEYGFFSAKSRSIYGGEELFRTIMDIDILQLRKLSLEQFKSIWHHYFKYGFTKFKPTEYFGYKESDIYSINSFNKYGDANAHWELQKRPFMRSKLIKKVDVNHETINLLIKFKELVHKRNATLFLTFPGFQAKSFRNKELLIKRIDQELRKNDFLVLGTPERYKIPNEMMFNSPYHLTKRGVDRRTQLLIEDIKVEFAMNFNH